MTLIAVPSFMVPGVNKIRKDTLSVITSAKKLGSYVYQVTFKAPSKFRYTFTNRLQNSCNVVLDNLFRANQYRKDSPELARLRKKHQMDAYTELRMLSYFAMLAHENKCLLLKQYLNITEQVNSTLQLLSAWMREN